MSSSSLILCILKTLALSFVINMSLIGIIGWESYNSQEMLVGCMNLLIGLFGPTIFSCNKKETEHGKD